MLDALLTILLTQPFFLTSLTLVVSSIIHHSLNCALRSLHTTVFPEVFPAQDPVLVLPGDIVNHFLNLRFGYDGRFSRAILASLSESLRGKSSLP